MEEIFLLLKTKPTDDLLYVLEAVEGITYTATKYGDFDAYSINLKDPKGYMLFELIKDINIFIPQVSIYLSDYLLCKKQPTADIIRYIEMFKVDHLFSLYLSSPRINQAQRNCALRFITEKLNNPTTDKQNAQETS